MHSHFSLKTLFTRYGLPAVLLGITGIVIADIMVNPKDFFSVVYTFSPEVQKLLLPAIRLGAIGAYIYVLLELGRRTFRHDVTSAVAMWCWVTLILGPVLAGTIAFLWRMPAGTESGWWAPGVVLFFAGFAPRRVISAVEGVAVELLKLGPTTVVKTRLVPLSQIRGIGPQIEERLGEEAFGALLDKILFGGLLVRGNVAAPAFGILIIASSFLVFLFPKSADTPNDANPALKTLILLLQLGFAWWLTDWHYGQMTVPSVLRSLGVFLSVLLISMIVKRTVWLLEGRFGFGLIMGWVSFSVLYAFLPAITGGLSAPSVPFLFFITVSVAYYFWQRLNTQEIELVSTLLGSSTTSMQVEEISGSLRVEADCGVVPHVYGVLCAWLLYSFLTWPAFSERISLSSNFLLLTLITTYILVGIAVIVQIVNGRLSFQMWQTDLNERHQMIKDVYDRDELQEKLRRIKKLLLRREVAFQLLIILSAIYLLSGSVFLNTTFPLSLVLVFGTFLFAVSSKSFALQLYKVFYNRTPLGIEVLDLSKAEEEPDKRTTWQKVKRAAKIIFTILLAVYGVLEVISNSYEMLQKLRTFQ